MPEISTTASYVRDSESRPGPRGFEHPALDEASCERVWALLKTPQTVETISRVLAAESGLKSETFHGSVTSLLAQLLAEELIVLSPIADSPGVPATIAQCAPRELSSTERNTSK
jgi:hypothetical protein